MKVKEKLAQVSKKSSTSNFISGSNITSFEGWTIGNTLTNTPPSLREGFIKAISTIKLFGISIYKKVTEIPVNEFFTRVNRSKKELEAIDNVVDKYMERVKKAEVMGQTALV